MDSILYDEMPDLEQLIKLRARKSTNASTNIIYLENNLRPCTY